MALVIHTAVKKKINERNITEKEIAECFDNRDRAPIEDPREEHKTNPPTKAIISRTNHNRKLKLIFIIRDGNVFLKSAFEPNQNQLWFYYKNAPFL